MGRGRSSYSSALLPGPSWDKVGGPTQLARQDKLQEVVSGKALRTKRPRSLPVHSYAPNILPDSKDPSSSHIPGRPRADTMARSKRHYTPSRVHTHPPASQKDQSITSAEHNFPFVKQDRPPTRPTFIATCSLRTHLKSPLSESLLDRPGASGALFDERQMSKLSRPGIECARGWRAVGVLGGPCELATPLADLKLFVAHDDLSSPDCHSNDLPAYTPGSYRLPDDTMLPRYDSGDHINTDTQVLPWTDAVSSSLALSSLLTYNLDTSHPSGACEASSATLTANEPFTTTLSVHQVDYNMKNVDKLPSTLPPDNESKTQCRPVFFSLPLDGLPRGRNWTTNVNEDTEVTYTGRRRKTSHKGTQGAMQSVKASVSGPPGLPKALFPSVMPDHLPPEQVYSRSRLPINALPSEILLSKEFSKVHLIEYGYLQQEYESVSMLSSPGSIQAPLHGLSPLVQALKGPPPIVPESPLDQAVTLSQINHPDVLIRNVCVGQKISDLNQHGIRNSQNTSSTGHVVLSRVVAGNASSHIFRTLSDMENSSHEPREIQPPIQEDGRSRTLSAFPKEIVGKANVLLNSQCKANCNLVGILPIVNHSQEHPAIKSEEQGEGLISELPMRTKIFEPWDTGEKVKQDDEHLRGAGASRKSVKKCRTEKILTSRHPNTATAIHRAVMNAWLHRCRLKSLRLIGARYTKPQPRSGLNLHQHQSWCHPKLSIFPGAKGHSNGFNQESRGPGGSLNPFDSSGVNGPGGYGSENKEIPWAGQDKGSEVLPSPALISDLVSELQPLDEFETVINSDVFQPYPPSGGNLFIQGFSDAPIPPVPLPDIHLFHDCSSTWDTGFVAGCRFTARQSGGPPFQSRENEPQWNAGFVAGCLFTAQIPGMSRFQPHSCGPDWNSGFVAGCTFASEAHRAPEQSVAQAQSDPTDPMTSVGHVPTVSQASNTTQTIQSIHALCNPIPSNTSQDLGVQPANVLPRDKHTLTAAQVTVDDNRPNVVESGSSLQPPEAPKTTLQHGRDKKRHKCNVCDKEFPKKYRLEDHMHQHRDQAKAHLCEFQGCSKSFTNRANMRRHLKTHDTAHGDNVAKS